MISSTALRYFAEVVRAGSLRGASERLFVAASAISRQIGLLEAELGAPLLERGRGRTGLRLTAAGEVLLRYTRHVGHELERARSEIEALKGLRKGHIRLGIPESFVQDVMPQILLRFNDKYPGVSFEVQVAGSPKLVELLGRDELDVALTFNAPVTLHVKQVFERNLPTTVLMSRNHPLAGRPFVKLSDCAEYGLAMPDESISAKQVYDEMFARARIKPRTVLVSNSYELLRSVAMTGLAITIVNARPGESAEGPNYRYVPLKDPRVRPQRLALCTFQGRNPTPVVASFLEQLKQELGNLEPS
ncbi:LysR family transcriptional regulator [Ramlibacter sp. AW1]|uniref:LysR family transcriptional regulator n=1 Tax=Ramlibacter aurantiacus TaxID=2801330 RepID=A0A936ZU80_9BURK|nr:LysR family transcriptional regulator [Ramlibacter aurantiacus]MBL0422651.1 LysR family transcriptional regulator [Ramlibacter aurantiacus]